MLQPQNKPKPDFDLKPQAISQKKLKDRFGQKKTLTLTMLNSCFFKGTKVAKYTVRIRANTIKLYTHHRTHNLKSFFFLLISSYELNRLNSNLSAGVRRYQVVDWVLKHFPKLGPENNSKCLSRPTTLNAIVLLSVGIVLYKKAFHIQ